MDFDTTSFISFDEEDTSDNNDVMEALMKSATQDHFDDCSIIPGITTSDGPDPIQIHICIMAANDLIKTNGIYKMAEIRKLLLDQPQLGITEEIFESARADIQGHIDEYVDTLITSANANTLARASSSTTSALSTDVVTMDALNQLVTSSIVPAMQAMATGMQKAFEVRDEQSRQQNLRMDALTERLDLLTRGMNTASAHVTDAIAVQSHLQATSAATRAANATLKKEDIQKTKGLKFVLAQCYFQNTLFFTREVDGVERMVIGNPQRLLDFDFGSTDVNYAYQSGAYVPNLHECLPLLQERIREHPEWYIWDDRSVEDELVMDNVPSEVPIFNNDDNNIDYKLAGMDADGAWPRALYPYAPMSVLLDLVNDPTLRYYIDPCTFRARCNRLCRLTKWTKLSYSQTNDYIQNFLGLAGNLTTDPSMFPPAFETIKPERINAGHKKRKEGTFIMFGMMEPSTVVGLLREFLFNNDDPILGMVCKRITFSQIPGGYHPCFVFSQERRNRRPTFRYVRSIDQSTTTITTTPLKGDTATSLVEECNISPSDISALVEEDDHSDMEDDESFNANLLSVLGKRKASRVFGTTSTATKARRGKVSLRFTS